MSANMVAFVFMLGQTMYIFAGLAELCVLIYFKISYWAVMTLEVKRNKISPAEGETGLLEDATSLE